MGHSLKALGPLDTVQEKSRNYMHSSIQRSLFRQDQLETEQKPLFIPRTSLRYSNPKVKDGYFQLQNRRYLGNKYKLLDFIESIVNEKCYGYRVFCDIFAGTGVVAQKFNKKGVKIIANDLLTSNFIPLRAFLSTTKINVAEVKNKINALNNIESKKDNYFSQNFANTYFTLANARKIGAIREEINAFYCNEYEKGILITSLLYATDKVANTVGHYDAFRKILDTTQSLSLLLPDIQPEYNIDNEIYNEDANQLIKKIHCDVLYIDPPYNSRQYSDAYHLLENLALGEKPLVRGKAKKMDRSQIKSHYCLQSATRALADLVMNADSKHILLSYNSTGESRNGRSNAKIKDQEIIKILKSRGDCNIFEQNYKAFTTGKSDIKEHTERIFYCKVTK